jgi:HSP20 family molecular chaperone IbpA
MPCSVSLPIKLNLIIGGNMLSLWNPFYLNSDLNRYKKLSNRSLLKEALDYGIEYKKTEDGSLAISVDLPGIEEKDIEVEVTTDNILQIRGERKTATSSYSVDKSFSVPEVYDTDKITAHLKNGVLTLTLPGKQVSKDVRKVLVSSK